VPTYDKPSARNAALAACLVAVATGALVAHNVPESGGDFSVYWAALRDGNPYARGLLYPLPTLLILLPLRWVSPHDGAVAFMAISVGLMVFGAVRAFGWPSLVMLLSPAFWSNLWDLQWGPLLVAAALLPACGFLAAGKANVGLAALAYKPNKWAIGGFAALVVLSLVVMPTWPYEMMHQVAPAAPAGAPPARRVPHTPPALWPGGALGLLGALRWREPRGRVLLACTLIPASAQLYDHLLVWLACRDWRESLGLSVAAWVGYIAFLATAPHDLTRDPFPFQVSIALSVYAPAALFMLRRPSQR
jgi:hypothetical protein